MVVDSNVVFQYFFSIGAGLASGIASVVFPVIGIISWFKNRKRTEEI